MAKIEINESGDYGFTAGAADSYIIKDGVTGVNITDNNADQAVQDNTTSNDLFVVENLTNTTVVINDYATVSGVDKNTNDDLLYIKNAGDGVKVAYFNIYTKAEAVNHQGGVDVAFVSTSANATGSVTAKNHLAINASGNYDKGAGYIDNVLAGEQKVNFNYNNLISKVRTLISKANTALGTSYTSSDDLKGTAYEAEMMALYNGTDENKSYPTYTIGDLSINSTTGPLLTWLYPVDELEFTQVAGTNEVCITHGNVTQRLSYEEATFSYYAIDQGTYEYKKIDDDMIAAATNRAVYELAEGAEPATIAGANYGGVWFRGVTSQDNITYRRDYNNLIMSVNDGRQVTVTDFFAETNKVVASFREDGGATGGVLNDNALREIFVNLNQFDGTYQATEYREVFEGSGSVSGLGAQDKVNLTFANLQLSRTFDGTNNEALQLTDGENTITVTDYFGPSYITRLIYDPSDPLGSGKSISSNRLDVTLDDTENVYTTHEKFQETIHGKGIIAADSIAVAGTNKDRIVLGGDATFERTNNGNLHVKYSTTDDIAISGFNFDATTGETATYININGALTTGAENIAVKLTNNFEYEATAYTESISGVGSVSGLAATDKIADTTTAIKRSGDDLVLDNITVKDYYTSKDMADAGQYASVAIGETTLGALLVTNIENVSDIIGTNLNETIDLVAGTVNENDDVLSGNTYTSNAGHGKIKIDAYAAGMGGDDLIEGTEGNDWINGGDGDDTIYGGTSGKDMLAGGDGENIILAGDFSGETPAPNTDGVEIYGGKDKDTIYVGGNSSTENYIWAHGGNDVINLYGGKNTIMLVEDGADATAGNDTIVGATSLDTLKFVSRDGDGEVIKGFAVSDLTFAKSGDDLTITTPDASVTTIADFFKGQNVDTILTTDGEKSIKDDAVINVDLSDSTGKYIATGYNELITGFSIDDSLKINAEWEDLSFSKDNKDLVISYGEDKTVTLTGFFNTPLSRHPETGVNGYWTIDSIETTDGTHSILSDVSIDMGNGSDGYTFLKDIITIDADSPATINDLYNRATITMTADTENQKAGNITINGTMMADGNDLIDMRNDAQTEGTITINGRAGDDIIYGSTTRKNVINTGLGYDTVYGGDQGDEIKAIENAGTAGTDDIRNDKTIYAGAGADTITLTNSRSFIDGEVVQAVNVVDAGAGEDTIIINNTASNTITGGAGNDTFEIRGGSATITDGALGDKIKFTNAAWEDLSFNKDNKDLVISYGEDKKVTLTGFFNGEKLDNILTSDSETPHSIKDDAVINVVLQSNENFVADENYTYNITLANGATGVTVTGLKETDTLNIDGELSYTYHDDLGVVISNDTKDVTINDFWVPNSHYGDYEQKEFILKNGDNVVDFEDETLVVDYSNAEESASFYGLWRPGFGTYDITGSDYADKLTAGRDTNIINGGDGDDEINAIGDNNTLTGGNGNDTFDVLYGSKATITDAKEGDSIALGLWGTWDDLTANKNAFVKSGNDLIINGPMDDDKESKVIVENFFSNASKVDTVKTFDSLKSDDYTEHSIKNEVIFNVVLDSEHPTFDKATSGYGDYRVAVSGNGSVTGLGKNDKLATSGQTVKYKRENGGGLIVCATNDGEPTDNITVTDFNFDGQHDINVNNGTTENMILNVDLDGTVTYDATSYAEIFSGVGSVTGFVNSKDGVVPKGSPVLIRENNSTDLSVDGITIKNFDFSTSNPFRIFDGNTSTQSTDYPIYVTLRDVGGEPTEYQSTGYKEYIDGKGIVNLSGDHPFDLSQDAVYVDGWSDIHYTRENNWDLHVVQGDDTDITVKGFNFAGGTDFNVTDGTETELTTNMTIDVTLTGNLGAPYISASGYAERITSTASTAIQFYPEGQYQGKDTLVFAENAELSYSRDGNDLVIANGDVVTTVLDYYTSGDMSVTGQFYNVSVKVGNLLPITLDKVEKVTDISNVSYFDSGDVATDKDETVYLVKGLKAGDITDAEKLARDTQGVVKLNDNNYEYTSNVGLGTHTLDSYAMGRAGKDNIYGSDGTDWIHGGDGDDYIYGGKNGADMLAGGDGNDHIYAKDEDGNLNTTGVELYGGAGNDTLVGGAGNDYIWGGAGTNTLTGGAGADTFDFTVEGTADAPIHDTITDATSADTIAIYRKGFADLKFTQESNDLVISADANNTLTVQGYFSNADKVTKFEVGGKVYTLGWHDGAMYNEIRNTDDKTITAVSGIQNWIDGQSKDASGKTITGGDKYDMLAGTQNADTITAGANGAQIYGDAGDDTITATNSFIVGGSGTDTINVSGGNNTILFLNTPSLNPTENDSYATGTDTVNGATSGDVLKFAYTDKSVGYSVADLSFAKDGDNLVITAKKDATHENTVILTDFFESTDNVVDTLLTTDGEKSIKDEAVFNIDLDKIEGHVFDKSAAGYTGYKVNVTGTGSVANIETGDKLNSAISKVNRSGNDLVLDTITVKDYYKTNNMADAGKYAGVSIATGEFGPTTLGDITVTRINNVSDIIGSDSNGEIIHLVKTENSIPQRADNEFPNYDSGAGTYISNVGHGKIKIDAYAAGMDGRDAITGTDGNDWINGGDGEDFIYGGTGGKDMLAGGDGENYILAGVFGPGDLKTYNEDGVEIYGGKDKDTIYVGGNNETENYIWAHGGDDVINLKGGKNTIMLVEDGAEATAGNDTIVGATSLDTLKFVSRNGEGEVIKGFAVSELSFAKSGDGLTITTPDASVTTIADFFKGQNVDTILTTDGEKSIKADAVFSVVLDSEHPTFDKATSGYGDYRVAVSGNGSVTNLGADDRLVFASVTDYALDKSEGLTISDQNGNSITVKADEKIGLPNVFVGNAPDDITGKTLKVSGFSTFDASEVGFEKYDITGTDAADTLIGDDGADTIKGGKGDDTIKGGEGNDDLTGGEGKNTIYTGTGNDVVDATEGANTIYVDGYGHKEITSGSEYGNTFVFSKGTAVINDATENDTIKFATLDPSKVEFEKDGNNLVIRSLVEGDEDTITIGDYFKGHAITKFVLGETTLNLEYQQSNVDGKSYLYNVIKGTDDPETIPAIKGIRNWINAAGGKDTVIGADKIDMLAGNAGDDVITASNPAEIYGGEGDDELVANGGSSFVVGGQGDDEVAVAEGNNIICIVDTIKESALNYGNDTIYGASSTDTLKFVADFGSDEDHDYVGYTVEDIDGIERDGYNLVLTTGENSVTLNNYFATENKDRVDKMIVGMRDDQGEIIGTKTISLTKLVEEELYGEDHTYDADDIAEQNGNVVINKKDDGDFKIDATNYAVTSSTGIKITNKSKTANMDVIGSMYNDTITSKNEGRTTVIEHYGTNKITTGKADDAFSAKDYSSNTVNLGAGNNIVALDSVGNNKITAGNGDNSAEVTGGSNNVKFGNGSNVVLIEEGVNTVKLGSAKTNSKGNNVSLNNVSIDGGVNKITSGSGIDKFVINDGNNNIKSGSGVDIYEIYGGYNTINAGNGGKVAGYVSTYGNSIAINGGTNIITSGKHNDIFEIGGGVNNIKGGAGSDMYIFSSLEEGEYSIINDSKGDDVYNFASVTNFDGLVSVTDKKGSDTIVLADDSLTLFFDGSFKYNSKTGAGTFKFGKDVALVEELTADITSGLSFSGKTVDKLNIVDENGDVLYNLDALKNSVEAWFTAQAMDGHVYKSVDAVFDTGNEALIESLLVAYTPNA